MPARGRRDPSESGTHCRVRLDQLGDVLLVGLALDARRGALLRTGAARAALHLLCEALNDGHGVGPELAEDRGHELGQVLVDTVAVHGVRVVAGRAVDCGRVERARVSC